MVWGLYAYMDPSFMAHPWPDRSRKPVPDGSWSGDYMLTWTPHSWPTPGLIGQGNQSHMACLDVSIPNVSISFASGPRAPKLPLRSVRRKGPARRTGSSQHVPDTPWDCHRTAAPLTPQTTPGRFSAYIAVPWSLWVFHFTLRS